MGCFGDKVTKARPKWFEQGLTEEGWLIYTVGWNRQAGGIEEDRRGDVCSERRHEVDLLWRSLKEAPESRRL